MKMNSEQMILLLEMFLHPQSFVSTFPDNAEVESFLATQACEMFIKRRAIVNVW